MIASIELGVGFFEEGYPEILLHRLGEGGLAFGVAWDQVINSHFLPSASLTELESIETLLIAVFRDKQPPEKLWTLSQD